jgi:hypothetical protein
MYSYRAPQFATVSLACLLYIWLSGDPFAAKINAASAPAKTAHNDAYGDPQPPGALLRLGTVRWRACARYLAFLPDGKAWRAGWRLTADPAASVPFLGKHVRPAEVDAVQVAKWLTAALLAPVLRGGRVRWQAGVWVLMWVLALGGGTLLQERHYFGFGAFKVHARLLIVAASPTALLAVRATGRYTHH